MEVEVAAEEAVREEAQPRRIDADGSNGSTAGRRKRPTAAGHSVFSIFHVAATHPASCNLEGFPQSLGHTVRRFDCRVPARGNIDRTGVGDARGSGGRSR